jgi:hypothetical protein
MIMKKRFRIGSTVRVANDNDNETYDAFRDKTLRVTSVSTKYMPAEKFFASGKPAGYHPGYDAGTGNALYDLELLDGTPINLSLYDWELQSS